MAWHLCSYKLSLPPRLGLPCVFLQRGSVEGLQLLWIDVNGGLEMCLLVEDSHFIEQLASIDIECLYLLHFSQGEKNNPVLASFQLEKCTWAIFINLIEIIYIYFLACCVYVGEFCDISNLVNW